GEHLVGVHVVRGTGAGLVDVDDELIAECTGKNFVGRLDNSVTDLRIEAAERDVRLRRCFLDQDGGGDEVGGCAQTADRKVLGGARRLDAVIGISRNLVLAKGIALGAEFHVFPSYPARLATHLPSPNYTDRMLPAFFDSVVSLIV